jgi:hypothetical protein
MLVVNRDVARNAREGEQQLHITHFTIRHEGLLQTLEDRAGRDAVQIKIILYHLIMDRNQEYFSIPDERPTSRTYPLSLISCSIPLRQLNVSPSHEFLALIAFECP